MSTVVDIVKMNAPVLAEVVGVIYPCILQNLSTPPLGQRSADSLEEAIDSVTLIIHYGYRHKPICRDMWKLFPYLL